MTTSFPTKAFGVFPARARLVGSLCSLVLAATGVVGLGLKADSHASTIPTRVQPPVAQRVVNPRLLCRTPTSWLLRQKPTSS